MRLIHALAIHPKECSQSPGANLLGVGAITVLGETDMPVEITVARDADDLDGLSEILREYLTWDIDQFREIAGVEFDLEPLLDYTFKEIDLYFPPLGRLILAREDRRLVGIGFLRPIRNEICEIKRMYVLPDQRGKGLGKTILARLIDEAKEIGYGKILLDIACYMTAAHSLYRSVGFTDVEYYSEAETDEAFKKYLVYMEMQIRSPLFPQTGALQTG